MGPEMNLPKGGRGVQNATKSAYVIYEWSFNNDCKKMQEWGAFFSESVIIVLIELFRVKLRIQKQNPESEL